MSLRQRSISARVIRVPAKPRSPRPAKRQHTANSITSARDSEICEAISPRHKLCKDCLFLMLQVAPVMAKGVQRPPCRMQTRDETEGCNIHVLSRSSALSSRKSGRAHFERDGCLCWRGQRYGQRMLRTIMKTPSPVCPCVCVCTLILS